jgi:hypothetical protein
VQAQPLSLDEKCKKKLEEKIQKVAKNTMGYTRKQTTSAHYCDVLRQNTKRLFQTF